jgi:hypothetical protein
LASPLAGQPPQHRQCPNHAREEPARTFGVIPAYHETGASGGRFPPAGSRVSGTHGREWAVMLRNTGLLAGGLVFALATLAGPRPAQAQFVYGGFGGPGWGISGGVVSPGAVVAPAPAVVAPPVAVYGAWGYPAYGAPVVRPIGPVYRYPAWGYGYRRYGYGRPYGYRR